MGDVKRECEIWILLCEGKFREVGLMVYYVECGGEVNISVIRVESNWILVYFI